MKGLIRYKNVTLWIACVFSVCFVVFNYIFQAKLTVKFEGEDAKENSYRYSCGVYIYPSGEMYDDKCNYAEYIHKSLSEGCYDDISISILDINSTYSNLGISYLSEISVGKDNQKYNLVWGSYPGDKQWEETNKCVVLGLNHMEYVYNRDGRRYVQLNGEEYLVTGCISTGRSHYLNNRILIYDRDYDDRFWKLMNDYIIMGVVQLVFESDSDADIFETAKEYCNILDKSSGGRLQGQLNTNSEKLRNTASQAPDLQYRRWAYIAYIFCIITTIVILQYWLLLRKKEFAIKRAFGFSVKRLSAQLLTEALLPMLAGVFVGMTVVLLNNWLAIGFYAVNMEMYGYLLLIAAGYIGLTLLLVGIYPMIWISRIEPVRLIRCREGN